MGDTSSLRFYVRYFTNNMLETTAYIWTELFWIDHLPFPIKQSRKEQPLTESTEDIICTEGTTWKSLMYGIVTQFFQFFFAL